MPLKWMHLSRFIASYLVVNAILHHHPTTIMLPQNIFKEAHDKSQDETLQA